MKTKSNFRFAAMVIIALSFITAASAQKKGSRNEVKGNSHAYAHVPGNYNYIPNRVVVVPAHYNFTRRIPAPKPPVLTVRLPEGFFAVNLNGVKYFVNNGIYFHHQPNRGFIQVERPAFVRHIPAGAVKVRINGKTFYRYHTIYFTWTPRGYRIV
jgi:hypothetical protein